MSELLQRDRGRTAEKVLHRGFVLLLVAQAEGIYFLEEVEQVLGQLNVLPVGLVQDEGFLAGLDLQLVIVVKVPEDAPAHLDFQHLYALLL